MKKFYHGTIKINKPCGGENHTAANNSNKPPFQTHSFTSLSLLNSNIWF